MSTSDTRPSAEAADPSQPLLHSMLRIRMVEEAIAARYHHEEMRCPVHLSIGQEAVAVGVASVLDRTDVVLSTHRAHAHYLAKGGSLHGLIAEIYGKVTGCARGRGGSMHLVDSSVGFMGSTGIVANSVPVGVGLGFSIKLDGTDQVSCVFLGDAAMEEGVTYESLNFALLKKLPVLFICENNTYSVYSHIKDRQPEHRKISDLVAGIGISSQALNGNDIMTIQDTVRSCVDKIRSGEGPSFIEFHTQRLCAHCGPSGDYEFTEEMELDIAKWKEQDPIQKLENSLLKEKKITQQEISSIQEAIDDEIATVFMQVKKDPFPSLNEITQYTYA